LTKNYKDAASACAPHVRNEHFIVFFEKNVRTEDITAITYRMSYDFVEKSAELSADEKAAFLGENACRFYGFKNLPELPYIKNMSE